MHVFHTIRNRCFTRPIWLQPSPSDELKPFQWRFIARFTFLGQSFSYITHSASKSFQRGDRGNVVLGPICWAFIHVMHKLFYMFRGNNYIYSRGHWTGIWLTKIPLSLFWIIFLQKEGRRLTLLLVWPHLFPHAEDLIHCWKASVQTILIYFYFWFVFLLSFYPANGINLEMKIREEIILQLK